MGLESASNIGIGSTNEWRNKAVRALPMQNVLKSSMSQRDLTPSNQHNKIIKNMDTYGASAEALPGMARP